jgi:hypothetical protein
MLLSGEWVEYGLVNVVEIHIKEIWSITWSIVLTFHVLYVPTWNYSILFLLFSFSQQFCCQCLFESSSIFSSMKIVHPWHLSKYFSTSLNILSYVSINIPSMSTRYYWKDSIGFTCSCSRSHAHNITFLHMWLSLTTINIHLNVVHLILV